MRIYINGKYRDMTEKEIELFRSMASDTPAPTPTIEERVASVEEDTKVIRAILMGEEGDNE